MKNKINSQGFGLLATACILMLIAVSLGAFGAHLLEAKITAKALKTYEVGLRYQAYHSLALFVLSALKLYISEMKLKASLAALYIGLIFFSLNCYIYAVTGIKAFAMLVPIGGISFIIFWALLFKEALRLKKIFVTGGNNE